MTGAIAAVIFDMDGLLVDSEVYWEACRQQFCRLHGCDWTAEDEHGVKGMNSPEWAATIANRCGLSLGQEEIIDGVVALMRARYRDHLPLLPGAVETVRLVGARLPLAVASSSPPELIETVLRDARIEECFAALVSADTIGRGKPAPDVFLAAARALATPPARIAVFEDSTAGIGAGLAAGMRVIAVPNPHYPPDPSVLGQAFAVLPNLESFDLSLLD